MSAGASRYKPFPTTKWTLIVRIAGAAIEDRERALSEISVLYRSPFTPTSAISVIRPLMPRI